MEEKGKFLIEVIHINEARHTHTLVRSDDLFTEVEWKDPEGNVKKSKIEPKDLYEVEKNLFSSLYLWITKGQIKHYLLMLNDQGEAIVETESQISGKVLKVARDWKGLGVAIQDSFGSRFEIPRIGIVIVAGIAVIILAFLVWKGFIPVPRSWTQ